MSQKSRNKKATGFIQTLKMYPLWSFTGIPSFFLGFYLDAGFGSFALFLYVIFLTIVIQSEIKLVRQHFKRRKTPVTLVEYVKFYFSTSAWKKRDQKFIKAIKVSPLPFVFTGMWSHSLAVVIGGYLIASTYVLFIGLLDHLNVQWLNNWFQFTAPLVEFVSRYNTAIDDYTRMLAERGFF